MSGVAMAFRWIAHETGALERRLVAVPRFSATIPMVSAAVPMGAALAIADRTVSQSRWLLRRRLREFQRTLTQSAGDLDDLVAAHRRFVALRFRFDALLSTVDIFADALTQRAESGIGELLGGLDALAADGMRTNVPFFADIPAITFLDRGRGGAVRRAFTRLPGGELNAIALIRVPRERLVGTGLASLLHEVGHQGVASLGLTACYARALRAAVHAGQLDAPIAAWWSSKLSEVLPDVWACAKLGAGGTLGLMGVLSSVSRLVFHDDSRDPHPMPYVRALTSVAVGAAMMPHPIWGRLAAMWTALHPLPRVREERRRIEQLVASMKTVAHVLAHERPRELGSRTLFEAIGSADVRPSSLLARLGSVIAQVRSAPETVRPCLALATVSLARHEGWIGAAEEHDVLTAALRAWANHGRTLHKGESHAA